MKVAMKASIHNRFDIYSTNIKTGKTKKVGMAENIVLNQMWTQLCNGAAYFSNIHYGTGTGTLAATRTALFTYLGTRAAIDVTLIKALPVSSWKRKIILNPEDNVGAILTEVGISYDAGATHLVTHALIKDSEGNQISITKTAVDIITIYATVYITFATSSSQLKLIGLADKNMLINYLVGGSAIGTCYFFTGEAPIQENLVENLISNQYPNQNTLFQRFANYQSSAVTWTADIPNKKRNTNIVRIPVDASNVNIAEIGLGGDITGTPWTIFRLTFPATGIYSGLPLSSIPVGVGDALRKNFLLPSKNIDINTLVVRVDGNVVNNYTTVQEADGFYFARTKASGGVGGTQTGNRVRFSKNGLVMALGRVGVETYDYSEATQGFTLRPTPVSPPPSDAVGVSLSADGNILATAHTSSPYIVVYDWTAGAWVKRANPVTLPTGAAYDCMLSENGLILAVAHTNSPFVTVYDWNMGVWNKRANPAILPAGNCSGLYLSADGTFLAISHATTPFVTTYDWTAGAWVKRADPSVLPTGNCTSISFSADLSVMSVTHDTSPYFTVYDWTAGAWVKRADPSVLTAGGNRGRLFSKGNALIVIHQGDSMIEIYDWTGVSWTSRPVGSKPDFSGYNDFDFRSDDQIAVICGRAIMWEWQGFTMMGNGAVSTMLKFDAEPTTGAIITADYTVAGIHKTTQRVIDLSCTITFGEGS